MSLAFTQLSAYSFTRANANPLDPAFWTTCVPGPGDGPPFEPLAVVSNQCVCPTSVSNANTGGCLYIGTVLPNDCYAEMVVTTMSAHGFTGIGLRSDITTFVGYEVFIGPGPLGGPVTIELANTGPGSATAIDLTKTMVINPGDSIGIAAVGSNIYALVNRVIVLAGFDPQYTSGSSYIEMLDEVSVNDVQIASFSCGSVTKNGPPSLTFTQLGADTFIRANENPLNVSNWTTMAPYAPWRIQTNTARPTTTIDINDCFEYFSSVLPPNDQYVEAKFTLLGSGEEAGIELRTNPGLVNVYDFDLISNGDGTAAAQLLIFEANDNVGTLYANLALPFSTNDVFRAVVVGQTFYWYQNGVLFAEVNDSSLASGYTGIFASTDTTNQVRLNNFVMGSVVNNNAGNAAPWLADQSSLDIYDLKHRRRK